ncbi:MAG TPA: GlsB/YeaQ/YmgE family stress response membrane protein [Aestuariivirga sp.]|nr:GlsB/YeaQ/YmgE family stress response membrane protein [Aestuariivirga sp.]
MGFLSTIIFGLVVGIIAKFLMPGKNEPQGFIMTALLGVVGAIAASYFGQFMGWYGANQGAGWIASIIGAMVVLGIYGAVTKNQG